MTSRLMISELYPANTAGQLMFFNKLLKIHGGLVRQKENDARNQEFVVPIIVLASIVSQLQSWFSKILTLSRSAALSP